MTPAIEERNARVAEDCEFLYEVRVDPVWWPGRVGERSLDALAIRLRRECGRPDLAQECQRSMRLSAAAARGSL